MGRTPDRHPGALQDWGILLTSTDDDGQAVGDPAVAGGITYHGGAWAFRDASGVFNPRTSANAAGSDTQIQYNNGGTAFGGCAQLFWDDVNNRLGVNTTPSHKLHVVNSTNGQHGIYSSSSGTTAGDAAIYGYQSSTAVAATYGVRGESLGTDNGAAGVYGVASGAADVYGVYGKTESTDQGSHGVYGTATAGSGGYFTASLAGACGCYGRNTVSTGTSYGTFGRVDSDSTSSCAVYGQAAGAGYGGYFTSTSGLALYTATGNVQLNGNVGIAGAVPTADVSLFVSKTFSASGTIYGIRNESYHNTADTGGVKYGSVIGNTATHTSGTIGYVIGSNGTATMSGAGGTVTGLIGETINTNISAGTVGALTGLIINRNQSVGNITGDTIGIRIPNHVRSSGTTTVNYGIYIDEQSGGQTGNYGICVYSAGAGVYAVTSSTATDASGVRGTASASTGATMGVFGTTASATDGACGVYGGASGAGHVRGVWGFTGSTDGDSVGVYGTASAGYGGYFTSSTGTAIRGVASAGTGVWGNGGGAGTYGVYGYNSSSGHGVGGDTSTGYGVYGAASSSGYGGYFTSSTGVGLYATTAATTSYYCAITGDASGNGAVAGVQGYSNSANASSKGVWGRNVHTSGGGYGGYFESVSGTALYAEASHASNAVFGVKGVAAAANSSGIGVCGVANAGNAVQGNTVSGYGVYAAASGSGYGGYFSSSSGIGVKGLSSSFYGVVAESDTTSPAKAAFRIVPQDTAPSSAPQDGDIYVNSNDKTLYIYLSGGWRSVYHLPS